MGERVYFNTTLSLSCEIFERNFYRIIIPKFPAYEKFWKDFIGQRIFPGRQDKPRFAPYEIVFLSGVSSSDVDKIRKIYRQITMLHYGQFCALASILMKIDELTEIEGKRPASNEQFYMKYRETFEDALSTFGNINNYATQLWNLVLYLKKYPSPSDLKGARLLREINLTFGADLAASALTIKEIIDARGFLDHWGQYPFQEKKDGTYSVPPTVRDRQTWDEIHGQDKTAWVTPLNFLKGGYDCFIKFLENSDTELYRAFSDSHKRFFSFLRDDPCALSDDDFSVETFTYISSSSATASGDGLPPR